MPCINQAHKQDQQKKTRENFQIFRFFKTNFLIIKSIQELDCLYFGYMYFNLTQSAVLIFLFGDCLYVYFNFTHAQEMCCVMIREIAPRLIELTNKYVISFFLTKEKIRR